MLEKAAGLKETSIDTTSDHTKLNLNNDNLQKLSTTTLRTRYSELEYMAVHVYVPTSDSARPVMTNPKLLLEVYVVVTCTPVVLQSSDVIIIQHVNK